MTSHILSHRDGAVGVITIDRTARFNSLDVRTAQDLRRTALQLARDAAVRTVVLRGEGGVFCSGADLKYIRGGGDERDLGYLLPESSRRPDLAPSPQATADRRSLEGGGLGRTPQYGEVFKQILEYLHSTISEIRRAPKPFIAAVDGMAAAGGFGLAMSCDLVFASARASFEWAYSKTGLTGAESSTFLLPRLVGLRRAMELMLLNPRLDAARAMEIGLVTGTHPVEGFDEHVMGVARRLAAGPTGAYGVAKSLLNRAAGIDRLDHHLDQELEHLARSADSAEFAEGIAAFFGKREPKFEKV